MIEYSDEAKRDVKDHHDWLFQRSERSAATFIARLETLEARVVAHPESFRRLSDGKSRRAILWQRRTSYLFDFRVEPGRIVVLRVWHGRQNRPE